MADNKTAGTARRSNSFSHISSAGNVSSDIVEAMDRIFPKSPSKFLQNPFRDSHGVTVSKQLPKTVSSSHSFISLNSTVTCSVSKAHITTDTTTTATAIFTDLSTSASGSKSPIMSSVPAYSNDMPSLPAAAVGENDVTEKSESNGTLAETTKQPSKTRASRVDLEICGQVIVDSPRSGVMEKICLDALRSEFEAEDVAKEKKRKKKQRKEHERLEGKADGVVHQDNSPLSLKAAQNNSVGKDMNHKVEDSLGMSLDVPVKRVEVDATNGYGSLLVPDLSSFHCQSNGTLTGSNEDWLSSHAFTVKQKLPKFRRHSVSVSKDAKYLKRKLLSCFVVLKRADSLLQSSHRENLSIDLDLSKRIKHLSDMCGKKAIECHKSPWGKKNNHHKKNKFSEILEENNSEDEFVNPGGRSLRRRNRNVCYVEPSEDDLIEEFASSVSKRKKSLKCSVEISEKESGDKSSDNQEPVKTMAKSVTEHSEEEQVVGKVSGRDKQTKQKSSEKHSPGKSGKNQSDPLTSAQMKKARKILTAALDQRPQKSSDDKSPSQYKAAEPYSKQTYTGKTNITDKDGRSLVYVFPKGTIVNTGKGGNESSKSNDSSISQESFVKKRRPGPASKTKAVSTTVAPVTTLSLPRSLLSPSGTTLPPNSLSGLPMPAFVQPPVSGSTTSPHFYMVKIDGKDYLVPMFGGAGAGAPLRPGALPRVGLSAPSTGPCRLLYQPVPSLPANRASAPSLTSPLTPFSTLFLPRGPLSSSTPLLSTSLSTNTALSSLPVPGNQKTTTTTSIPTTATPRVSQTKNGSNDQSSFVTTAVSLPGGSTSLVSLVRPPLPVSLNNLTSTSQTIMVASSSITNGTLGSFSTVAPLAAPPSTTVLRSNRPRTASTIITSASQVATSSNTATGARCFRIIVPACSATGTPARIATLGTSANSNPLTHMSITSALLPQRKRSADKEMSPEKRAAKRRRLEKKYPLPPGVVIKTEPLDTPQTSTSVQAGSMRSLLAQNIQLITNSRTGSGSLQNIRIISPPTGSRQMRLGPNLVLRAPNVSLATGSISTVPAVTVSRSSLVLVTPPVESSSFTGGSSTTPTVTTANLVSSTIPATTTSSNTTSANTITSTAGNDSSCVLSSHQNKQSSSSSSNVTASDKITTLSYSAASSASSASTVVNLSPVTSKDKSSNITSTSTDQTSSIDSLKDGIASLKKLIDKQESIGLQGARLQKLKEVLTEKENALAELLKDQQEADDIEGVVDSNDILSGNTAQSVQGFSVSDPVVID